MIESVVRDALHETPGVECSHVDWRQPECERDAAHVASAIRAHLLSDEVAERAGFATWAAHLDGQGLRATEAEFRFGWDHLPPNHRAAWAKRAQKVIAAVARADV